MLYAQNGATSTELWHDEDATINLQKKTWTISGVGESQPRHYGSEIQGQGRRSCSTWRQPEKLGRRGRRSFGRRSPPERGGARRAGRRGAGGGEPAGARGRRRGGDGRRRR